MRFLKRTAVGCLLLVHAGTALAAEAWKFPSPAAESEAKKKYPGEYWYEQYPTAQKAVDREERAKTEEIIARLRIAIALNTKEESFHPTEKRDLDYYPYYYLARAFVWAGDPRSAGACLEREMARGKIQKSKLEPKVAALRAGIDAELNKTTVLAEARKVLAWESQGSVVLSAASKTRLARIKSGKETLEQGTADTRTTSESVISEAIDLSKEELGRRDRLVTKLSDRAWKSFLQTVPAPAVCQASTAWKTTSGDLASAVAAVEACNKAVGDALRQAASSACSQWKSERLAVKEQWESYNKLPGSKKEAVLDDLPQACSITWETVPAADLEAKFESLDQDRARIEKGLEKSRNEVQALLKEKEGARLQSIRAARNSLPEIPPECVRDLQIEDIARQIGTLRQRLDVKHPTDALLEPDKLVEKPLGDLRAQVQAGVELIVNDKCPNLARGSLDELSRRNGAFQQGAEGIPCSAASKAKSDVNQCWIMNAEPLKKRLQTYDALLARATSPGGVQCLASLTATLRTHVSTFSASAAWTTRAKAAQDDAQKCLIDFSKQVEQHQAEVSRLVPEIARLLEEIPKDAPLPPDIVQQLGSMRSTLPGVKDQVDRIAPLYADAGKSPEALKGLLGSAGLAVGAEVLASVVNLHDEWALRVLRDAAAGPRVEQARATIGEWDHVLRKLGPFQALSEAFSSFAKGDLDGAIARLREAEAKGRLAAGGKESARLHAALSYFLYEKRLAAGSTETAGLLEKDARDQADLAKQADPALKLDGSLFRSQAFKKFYSAEGAQTANR